MLWWSGPRLRSWYKLSNTTQRKALSTLPFHFWEYFSTPSFGVSMSPALNVHFYFYKQSDNSTLYAHTCGISVHSSLMLLHCMCTCTGMIQSLEWLISYPIIVAGILNLYLTFCQRWSLTLFKSSSLLLFFLEQHFH